MKTKHQRIRRHLARTMLVGATLGLGLTTSVDATADGFDPPPSYAADDGDDDWLAHEILAGGMITTGFMSFIGLTGSACLAIESAKSESEREADDLAKGSGVLLGIGLGFAAIAGTLFAIDVAITSDGAPATFAAGGRAGGGDVTFTVPF